VQTVGRTQIYSEVTAAAPDAMQATATEMNDGHFNTGNYIYSLMPIYTSYSPTGTGTTFFDTLPD
jgi:hypothetical protein